MTDSPEIGKETLQFYEEYVGIKDSKELIQHLKSIQQELIDGGIVNYRCIQNYKFAFSRLYSRFFYKDLIKLGKTLNKPYFLDIGCCTGTDLRKLIIDGYPKEYLIGMDIQQKYIDIGYHQFKDTPSTCPIQFIIQDVFTITSDYFLVNTISIIHAGSLFHLFEDDQAVLHFLKKVSLLLKPGGILIGGHVCADKTITYHRKSTNTTKYLMDCNKFVDLLSQSGYSQIKMETVPKEPDSTTDESCLRENNLHWMSFYAVYKIPDK